MSKHRILIVEDEHEIATLIEHHLINAGFDVFSVISGIHIDKTLANFKPDVMILDRMLPGKDGTEICREIKGNPATASLPIIMLTAKSEEADIVSGLEAGADDYVTKPFSPKVLLARVQNILKRVTYTTEAPQTLDLLTIGDLTIDDQKHKALIHDVTLKLTLSEYQALYLLASHPGRVFNRSQIMESLHGYDKFASDRTIDVLIVGLRKKLGHCASYIETVRGIGYRFIEL